MSFTQESWVALPRTLARRLYELPPPAFKLYIYCYLNTRFSNYIGLATTSIYSAAEMLGADCRKIKRALQILEDEGLIDINSKSISLQNPLDIRIKDFKTLSEIIADNESFVPLSRGLNDHLSILADLELKILIFGIVEANYVGKSKGQFSINVRDLGDQLGSNRNSVSKALNSLMPYYLEFHRVARNQYEESKYLVNRYKTKNDFLKEPDIYRSPDGRISNEPSCEEFVVEHVLQPWR
jgi:DNA-binding transcriptional regulator YhcF (GntR family)